MSNPKIVTITNPAELILAQLAEIRAGNAATRAQIERCQRLLKGAAKEEARLEKQLEKLLDKERAKSGANKEDLITVCDHCLQASCWQSEFYCDDYKTAGTTTKKRAELAELNRENPSYWKTDKELAAR